MSNFHRNVEGDDNHQFEVWSPQAFQNLVERARFDELRPVLTGLRADPHAPWVNDLLGVMGHAEVTS